MTNHSTLFSITWKFYSRVYLVRTFLPEVFQGLYKDALFFSKVCPQRLRTQKPKSDRPTKDTQL
jgi:hypothetical protein